VSPQDPWPASGPDAGSAGGSPTPPPAVPANIDPPSVGSAAPIPPGWSTIQPPPYQPGAAGPFSPVSPAPTGPPPGAPPTAPPGFSAPGFSPAPGYQQFPAYAPNQFSGWTPPPPAPKPGVIPLRPLGVGEILDGAISYMRFNPRTVFAVSAVISIVAALLQAVALWIVFGSLSSAAGSLSDSLADSLALDAAAGAPDPFSSGQLAQSATQVLISLFSIVVSILATGLFTVVMAEATLGRKITVSDTWARTRGRLLPLLGTTLLTAFAFAFPIILAIVAAVALSAIGGAGGLAAGIGLVVASIFVAIWLAVRLLLGTAICVLERVGPVRSLGRSWALSVGRWWRLLGVSLLAQIIAAVVGSIIAVPFAVVLGVAAALGGDSETTSVGFIVALTLGTLLSSLITLPFATGVSSLLYIDTRMRREGLDITLAAAASAPAPAPNEATGGKGW